MKTSKRAKCGIHSNSFCNTKHDAPQCDECILVKHREKLYVFKNGYKLKRCPQCGQYKMLHEFKPNSKGHKSWCYDCHKTYSRNRHHNNNKTFMIGHKVDGKKTFIQVDSSAKMLKHIRKYIVEGNETLIEIKRIK